MNELVSCWACSRPGRLRLDTYPAVVEHGRDSGARCELPPRDVPTTPVRRPTWLDVQART